MTKTRVAAQILTPTGRIVARTIEFVSDGRPTDGQLHHSFARYVGSRVQDVRLTAINFL